MFDLIKFFIYFIIILLFFSFLPKSFLDNLKKYFNWDVFLDTLKKGWSNFIDFIQESTGINFSEIPFRLKQTFGIDIIAIWNSIVDFLKRF